MTVPFASPRTTVVVVVLTAVSLATGLVLLAIGPEVFGPRSVGADAFSRSAVGHRAFVETLERLGVPVVVSRHRTSERAGPETLLVLLEPRSVDLASALEEGVESLEDLVAHGGPSLVVLPRRTWAPDAERPGWVRRASSDGGAAARAVLDRLGLPGDVAVGPAPAAWTTNRFDARPDFPDGVQTIPVTADLEPVVATADRLLVGRRRDAAGFGGDEWIVADPDLFASHGLHRGENALLVARLVEAARPPGGVVVVDETAHGHARRPSLWSALFRWPLVLPLLTALAASLLWVAAGSVRFGAALPLAPAVAPGSRFLIENSADLLRLGGHAAHALDRYLSSAVQDVGRATHAPARLTPRELREWIAGAGAGRRVATRVEDLEAMVSAAGESGDRRRVLETAVRIHGWRKEMTHGPRGDS